MKMRPFFSYYGGKWRDAVRNYPRPAHKTIIEPFAGSAGYSVRYYGYDVRLYDVDPVICAVWDYLIHVKPSEILAIPDVLSGQTVDDLHITQEARWLVGFWLNRACSTPCLSPSAWMRSGASPTSFWGNAVRQRIAVQVEHIRHWSVRCASYESIPQQAATWFVDPPYQVAGSHYRHGSDGIDFAALGDWCRARDGLVIVCENSGADWLPFTDLADVKTARKGRRSREAVWIG